MNNLKCAWGGVVVAAILCWLAYSGGTAAQVRGQVLARDYEAHHRAVVRVVKSTERPAAAAARSSPPAGQRLVPRSFERNPAMLPLVFSHHPDLHAMFIDAYRKNVLLTYEPFFRLHNVSPADRERIVALLWKSREDSSDLQVAAFGQGLTPEDPAVKRIDRDRAEALKEGVKSILGEDGVAKFDRYNRSYQLREGLDLFRTLAIRDEAPASTGQIESLIEIMIKHPLGIDEKDGVYTFPDASAYASILQEAKAVLSPRQYDLFQLHMTAKEAQHKLSRLGIAASAAKK